jgi:predicted lipoprotein
MDLQIPARFKSIFIQSCSPLNRRIYFHAVMSIYSVNALLSGVLAFVVLSCAKEGENSKPDFDRTALVVNLANNIIIPNYEALGASVDSLDVAVTAFNASANATTLEKAQVRLKAAYSAWQHCAPFTFGPADQALLGKNVNIFPTSVVKINNNIDVGGYNLDQLSNLDAKGFPAMDYMLFGTAANSDEILLKYTTDADAGKRKAYLVALSANIKTLCHTVLNAWISTGGNYVNTFLNAKGTDIGSAIGLVINGIDYDLDLLKNYKVAIPVGIMPSSGSSEGDPLPEKVEGYYSGISLILLLEEITTLQDIYLGRSVGGDNAGLDDYIVQNNIQYDGSSLNDVIKNQFTSVFQKLSDIPGPLSDAITSDPGSVKALYSELQKLLVLLKTDMPSSLGILITYEDNDGD